MSDRPPSPDKPEPGASPSALERAEEILGVCLDAKDPEEALRRACEEHPELEETLRRVYARMLDFGLLDAVEPPPAGLPSIPGFTLLEKLGQGGMGVVYRAWQDNPHREVAVKVVRPELLHFEGQRARFAREIETVATLSHPNIVPILEVGEADGVPWFSMEYVRGAPLSAVLTHLREEGARPATLHGSDVERLLHALEGDANGGATASQSRPRAFRSTWLAFCVEVLERVASALSHAHERGVLHRDVKPSNIMLTLDGRVQLLDFGLARKSDDRGLTRSTAELGSLPYIAPELLRGRAVPTEQLDVYAIGVTMYEMLTLTSPFLGPTPHATRARILEAHPKPLRRQNPNVTWDVETVCSTAMAPESERRYPNMGAFRADLERLRERLPILAKRPGALLRLRRWQQRHPAISVGLVTALLLASVSAFVLLNQSQNAKAELNAALVESERQREIAERALHASRLALVQTALTSRNYNMARTNLLACAEERRGWAWKHLELRTRSATRSLQVHERAARLALTKDASSVLVLAKDGALALVDCASGEVLRRVATEAEERTRIDVSPTGERFVLDEGPALVVRKLPSLEVELRFPLRNREHDPQFSVDGERLWTIDQIGRIRERELPSGRELQVWPRRVERPDTSVGLRLERKQGELLAFFSRASNEIRVFTSDGRPYSTCSADRAGIDDVRFYDDGQSLVSISTVFTRSGSVLETFRTESGARQRLAIVSTGPRRIDVAPNGRSFALAGKGLFVLAADSLRDLEVLNGHEGETLDCAFGGDGRIWTTGSLEGTLCEWVLDDVSFFSSIPAHEAAIRALRISPNSRYLASADIQGGVEVHETTTRQKLAKRRVEDGRIHALAFVSDERIATGGVSGKLRVLAREDLEELEVLDFGAEIRALERAEDGYVVHTEAGVFVQPDDGTRRALRDGDAGVSALAITRGPLARTTIALGYEDGRIEAVRADGSTLWSCEAPPKVVDLAFKDDGTRLASVHAHKTVALFDAERGAPIRTWSNHQMRPSRVRFGPGTDEFYTTSWGGEFRFWDARYEQGLGLNILASMLLAMDTSPDGRFVAVAGINRRVELLWATREH